MLAFENLRHLDAHLALLQKRIKDSHTLFLVGWCVRDLLLNIEKKPIDIDFTMAGDPKHIDSIIDKQGMSYFMTEKFGTMTLIKKVAALKRGKLEGSPGEIKYELTPLRTEGGYEDYRHPGEIQRSDSLLHDSDRRDFTINCMYYTNVPYQTEYTKLIAKKDIHEYTDETFLKKLQDHGYLFLADHQLLIIQDHTHIAKLFPKGVIGSDHLTEILKSATIFSTKKNWKSKIGNWKSLGILVDPHKGLNDCIAKRLRAVGDADKRFQEDALRIIRAIRFVTVLNAKLKNCWNAGMPKKQQLGTSRSKHWSSVVLFDYIKETRNSVKKNHALVKNVAKERIKDEIMKAFTEGDPFGFIALLDEAKILEILFPALATTKYIEQPVRYHPFDVYTHTLLTLFQLQRINKDPLVRLAMLYHDVGKVEQFAAYGDNLSKEEIRAILAWPLNHRRSSPEYAKKDFKALGFSTKDITTIARYIANHHKPEEMLATKEENVEKKVRTFFSEAGYEKAMNLLDITMGDRLGQYNPLQNSSDISDIDKLKSILKKLHKQEGQFTMKDLAVNGSDIMHHFKLPASPAIWHLLKKAMEWVLNDIKARNTEKEIFGFLKIQMKHLKTNGKWIMKNE